MPKTLVRQDGQIRKSEDYDDTVPSGSEMESESVSLEDDLNNLRSQVNRIISVITPGNWYDDIPTINGKKRSIRELNIAVDTLEVAGGVTPVSASETGVPEGNHSLTGLANDFVVEYITIQTTSTDWTFTVYSRDDYVSDPIVILKHRGGHCSYNWNHPYVDKDGTQEFHYNFTDNVGSAIHDIEVSGIA